MGKVIAVASGKGGTGKTTTVAAVASCTAMLGFRTLGIDFDAGLRNLDLALCMSDYAVADFVDVTSARLSLTDACHESPHTPNLFFLAAPAIFSEQALAQVDAGPMLSEARKEFDYTFIDTPAGISAGFKLAHCDCDMSVIVTTGELPAMRDAQMAAGAVRDMGVGEVRLLINRVSPAVLRKIHTTYDDVIDTVGAQLIGAVREDRSVILSLHRNIPLISLKKRGSIRDFLDVARRITGEDIPLRYC